MDKKEIDELVKELAIWRQLQDKHTQLAIQLEDEIMNSDAAKAMIKQQEEARSAAITVKEIEDHLREAAVANFDGENKQPHPAITLGEYTVVEYDEPTMLSWAIEHNHPGLLSLNKSAAKKVATGPTAPDFVKVSKEIRAKIASDLSEYLS